ncbi:MAG: aminoglycoside phosphotransferase family protein [Roseibacillus sp.]
MKPTKRSLADGESASGSVNLVTRSGDHVLRPMGHWSESVHELLRFLEYSRFDYSPRFRGIDFKAKKERLTYLDGEVALRPWPKVLRSLKGLEKITEMLKKYHEVAAKFEPTVNNWHLVEREISSSDIIRHGDIGPWNMVWKGEQLVGLIDWDFAEPGTILEDLAQTAWHCIPLKPPKRLEQAGVLVEHQEERMEHFCRAYGVSTEVVLQSLHDIHKQELQRMRTHGSNGIQPWKSFLERGDIEVVLEDSQWLLREISKISGDLDV